MTVLERAPGFVLPVDEAEDLAFFGARWRVLVSSATSAGDLLLAHATFPLGSAPPVHRHTHEDETWYMLSGAARFHLEDEVVEVGAGTAVWGPRGQAHSFEVLEEGSQMLIVVTSGANFESFVREMSGDEMPSVEVMLAAMARVECNFLAPPPGH
jgi:mannose-6-phosphate isomerase-like protein (cupin superfamily)